jgi:oxaloacetate decarboxylase beta subunit
MEELLAALSSISYLNIIMYAIGLGLIVLAIKKEYEPMLLLPMVLEQYWSTCPRRW